MRDAAGRLQCASRGPVLLLALLALLAFGCSGTVGKPASTPDGGAPGDAAAAAGAAGTDDATVAGDGAAPIDAAGADGGPQPVKAGPSAEGFGKHASGGRGGEVRKVTNLDDSGAGSFRAAVETPGAAYVVFEVAGTINLQSRVNLTADKTIAGETAFRNGGHGITLKINQGTTKNTLVVVPATTTT